MRDKLRNKAGPNLRAFISLFVIMVAIGSVTTVAAVSTYEVIFSKDTSYSNVIRSVSIVEDASINDQFIKKQSTNFNNGSFGIPKKIKLPETRTHIDITNANFQDGTWKASRGLAHTFVTDEPIQKVFGQAVIYMRYNTPTTKQLGDVISGDVVNVVTTEGWQLGYQVTKTSSSVAELNLEPKAASQIVVIMIDDTTNKIECFSAQLTKVGERI